MEIAFNINRAAEILHITQPTLSRQLSQLEEEVGVKLFYRGARKITLTNEGMLLRRRAEEILSLVDRTKKELIEKGLIDIGVLLEPIDMERLEHGSIFEKGIPNPFGKYFTGQSYLAMLTELEGVRVANVTFEPACRNNWHIHHGKKGGGQILLVTNGRGWYQEWGKEAQELHAGDVIAIPVGVKHWHGVTKDSWFSHVAIEVPGENTSNEWLEPVSDEEYMRLE